MRGSGSVVIEHRAEIADVEKPASVFALPKIPRRADQQRPCGLLSDDGAARDQPGDLARLE